MAGPGAAAEVPHLPGARVLIVEARFYAHINDLLLTGARRVLEAASAEAAHVVVPGALEIPPAIAMAQAADRFDAYVALGCVIRGETTHYELVSGESCRGLMDLGAGLELYRHKVEVLEKHCEAEKRDPATIARSGMTGYIAGEDQAEVDRKVQEAIANAPERFRRTHGKPPMTALWGTPPQIIEQIQELEAAGLSRLMLQYRTPPARSDLEFVASEILPKVSGA